MESLEGLGKMEHESRENMCLAASMEFLGVRTEKPETDSRVCLYPGWCKEKPVVCYMLRKGS